MYQLTWNIFILAFSDKIWQFEWFLQNTQKNQQVYETNYHTSVKLDYHGGESAKLYI